MNAKYKHSLQFNMTMGKAVKQPQYIRPCPIRLWLSGTNIIYETGVGRLTFLDNALH